LDTSDGEIRFVGDANDKLKIQTVGTRSSSEFEIEAKKNDNAIVDITLGGPFSKIEGDASNIDLNSDLDFDIKGEAEGSFSALILSSGVASSQFNGVARRDVDFKFDQGSKKKFEGRSDGTVSFLAAVGTAAIAEQNSGNSRYGFIGCNSACASGTTTTTTNQISAVNVNVVTIDSLLANIDDKPDSTVSDSYDQNDLTKEEYDALDEQLEAVDIDIDIDIDIKVVALGHERYYVAYPKEYKGKYKGKGKYRGQKYSRNNVVCFRQVGPGSAIFPGLLSLVQIDFDNIPVDIIAGLPEIDDADTSADDTTDDVGDDNSDDSGDDVGDDNSDDSSDDVGDDNSDDSEEIIIVPGLNEIPAESGGASE
jgi:hypothetical protein